MTILFCNTLTHFIKLPSNIQDLYKKIYGVHASDEVLRFCKTELMQAIWLLLMDEEFMEAYEHGMLVTCGDGVVRRLFPRFFSYSADYPEK